MDTKQIQLRCPKNEANEAGVFLLLVALALVTIVTVIGLGIDGGSMFLSGLNQQRAADAASLAGGRMIGRLPDDVVQQIAENVARDNFDLNAIHYSDTDLASHFMVSDIVDNQIQVTTSSDMPTMIAGRVVAGPSEINVRAGARARRNFPAAILVIDNTGSMEAAARDSNGALIRNAAGQVMTQLDVTKQAAINFVRSFSTRDRIGIASYSIFSEVERSISLPYDEDELIAAINSIPQVPWATNIQKGLLRGLRDMENWLNSDPALRSEWGARFIVLMTDGLPNQNVREHNRDADNLINNWTVEDDDDPDSDPEPNPFPAFPSASICRGNPNDPNDVLPQNFIEAQLAANFIRSYGHTVLTVAVGPRDNTVTESNPWGTGNPFSTGRIRGNFMRWLANDYQGSLEQDPPDVAYPEECVPSYDTMANSGYGPGISLISNNAGDIDGMFQAVASYISLRLTS